jgi:hypothetical protein
MPFFDGLDDLDAEIEQSARRFLNSVADAPVICSEMDAMELELKDLPVYLQEHDGNIH